MKIRLMGTEDECRGVAGRLAAIVGMLPTPTVHVTSTTDLARGCRRALPPEGSAVAKPHSTR